MIKEGLAKLRAAPASSAGGAVVPRLWRGMCNVRAPDELMRAGGTELAPLSF